MIEILYIPGCNKDIPVDPLSHLRISGRRFLSCTSHGILEARVLPECHIHLPYEVYWQRVWLMSDWSLNILS